MPREYGQIKKYETEILSMKEQGQTAKRLCCQRTGQGCGIEIYPCPQRCKDKEFGNGKRVDAGFSLACRKEVKTSVKYMVIYRHKDKYRISEMCRFFSV